MPRNRLLSSEEEDSPNVLEQSILLRIDEQVNNQDNIDSQASFNEVFQEHANQGQVDPPVPPVPSSAVQQNQSELNAELASGGDEKNAEIADSDENESSHATSSEDYGLRNIVMIVPQRTQTTERTKQFSNQVKPILSRSKHKYKQFDKKYLDDFLAWSYSNHFEEQAPKMNQYPTSIEQFSYAIRQEPERNVDPLLQPEFLRNLITLPAQQERQNSLNEQVVLTVQPQLLQQSSQPTNGFSFSLETDMALEEILDRMFEGTKIPGDQDASSKKAQIQNGVFKQMFNRIKNNQSSKFEEKLTKALTGIDETETKEFFEKIKNIRAAYSNKETRQYEPGTLELILQKSCYNQGKDIFKMIVGHRILCKILIFSIENFLIDRYHPARQEERKKEIKKNFFMTQFYYYQKLAYIIRYLFVSQGKERKEYFQNLMERIKTNYRKMLKKSQNNQRKRVVKQIEKYRQRNKDQEIKRGKKNAAVTIAKKPKKKPKKDADRK